MLVALIGQLMSRCERSPRDDFRYAGELPTPYRGGKAQGTKVNGAAQQLRLVRYDACSRVTSKSGSPEMITTLCAGTTSTLSISRVLPSQAATSRRAGQ